MADTSSLTLLSRYTRYLRSGARWSSQKAYQKALKCDHSRESSATLTNVAIVAAAGVFVS